MVVREVDWTRELAVAMVEETIHLASARRMSGSITHFHGRAPGKLARVEMIRAMDAVGIEQPSRATTLTESPLIRGAAKAYAWLSGSKLRAFAPRERVEAIRFVFPEADEATRECAERTFEELYRLSGVDPP